MVRLGLAGWEAVVGDAEKKRSKNVRLRLIVYSHIEKSLEFAFSVRERYIKGICRWWGNAQGGFWRRGRALRW